MPQDLTRAGTGAERPDWLAGGPGFEPRLTESGALSSAVEPSLWIPGCCLRQFGTSTIDLRHLDAFNCLDLGLDLRGERNVSVGAGREPGSCPAGDFAPLAGLRW